MNINNKTIYDFIEKNLTIQVIYDINDSYQEFQLVQLILTNPINGNQKIISEHKL